MADAKKTEAPAGEAPKKRGKLLLFIIIGVLVLVLGGGVAAYMIIKKNAAAAAEEEGVEEDAPVKVVEKPKRPKKPENLAPPAFYKFEKPFVVKLQTEQQEAYLQVEVQLRVFDALTIERVKQYEPELKHRINFILLSKKMSDVSNVEGVQRLSNELRDALNHVLDPPPARKNKKEPEEPADEAEYDAAIQAVLFTSIITQ